MIRYHITPLSTQLAREARAASIDRYGNVLTARVQETAGAPCRHCLRRVEAGEELLLLSHSPFDVQNPYKEVGPIFVHAAECERYTATGSLPAQLSSPVVLRGYNQNQEIVRAAVVVDGDAESRLQSLLADPNVGFVHARSLTYGCYYYRVDRAD